MDLIFRTDYSNSIGAGHLWRCIALAETFPEYGIVFMVQSGGERLPQGIPGRLVELPRFESEDDELRFFQSYLEGEKMVPLNLDTNGTDWKPRVRAMFFDITHRANYSRARFWESLLGWLRDRIPSVVLIDGLAHDSLADRMVNPKIDFLITPYVGSKPRNMPGCRHLDGPRFFILGRTRTAAPKHVPRRLVVGKDRAKVLVTCGGSDPSSMTPRILETLQVAAQQSEADSRTISFDVTVILGPAFSDENRARIRELAIESSLEIRLKDAPENLLPEFARHDLIVSATGLTRYELAFTGTPAVLVSPFQDFRSLDERFAQEQTAEYIGSFQELESSGWDRLGRAVFRLLEDFDTRVAMSERGKRLVDGVGAERIRSAMEA